MFSCNNTDTDKPSKRAETDASQTNITKSGSNKVFAIDVNDLLKDYSTWYNYTYYNIRLAQDFIGLDVDSANINKAIFLKRLATGSFVPFKTMIRDNLPVYKLHKPNNTNKDIQSTIKEMALAEIAHLIWKEKNFLNMNLLI